MIRYSNSIVSLIVLFVIQLDCFWQRGGRGVEGQMLAQFEKCCGLGKSWAKEGLKCEKFTGPVPGVPTAAQSVCLEAVDICCVKAYHEQQCEKGKSDARKGLSCETNSSAPKSLGRGDYHRDCCEACRLGKLTGSMGQGCALKGFTFGYPWDPAFLECCREYSPTTTTEFTDSTNSVETSSDPTSSPNTENNANITSMSTISSENPSEESSSSTIPTPALDDICVLMKGLLCTEICIPTPESYYCACKDGSKPLEDGKTCRSNTTKDSSCGDKHSCTTKEQSNVTSTTEMDQDNELDQLCPTGYRYNSTTELCNDIDECLEEDPCPGVCENLQGSYHCIRDAIPNSRNGREVCIPGYEWNDSMKLCTDIDECNESNKKICNESKPFCINTQGNYSCVALNDSKSCPAGFKFDTIVNNCKDVDECSENIHGCLNDTEECRNTNGAYECDIKCRNGFKFSINLGTCVDVDECEESSRPCPDPNTECENTVGSYLCSKINKNCTEGYRWSLTKICEDIDECQEDLHACKFNQTCHNEIGSYRCDETNPSTDKFSCTSGYFFNTSTGKCSEKKTCEQSETACGPGKRCAPSKQGFYRCTVTCKPGFQADEDRDVCLDIDECNLGLHTCNILTQECVNTNGSYTCQLLPPITRLSLNKSTNSGKQAQILDSYPINSPVENCRNGYKKDNVSSRCYDIDECLQGPGCREHERCLNVPGNYECLPLCTTGWYYSMTSKDCQDVDECLLGRHNCQQNTHRCLNIDGSYICELIPPCRRGFKKSFNGSCYDINECAENQHNCRLDEHQYCVNREGSYECLTRFPECPNGYEYSLNTRHCEDIDECYKGRHACKPEFSERCVNLPGTYRCERPLLNRHRQRQKPACPSGYRYEPQLRNCTDIDECAEGLDSCGKDTCYNQPGGYSCARAPSPITKKPSTPPLQPSADQKCLQGTRYVRNRGCVDIDECREIPEACSSNERCVNTMGSFICNCKTGFRKDNLTQACVDINECQLKENDCLPTQRCDNTIGSYTCIRFLPCGTGYTLNAATEICEDDDECVLGSHDCGSGYHCRNTLGSYRCDRNSRKPQMRPPPPSTTPLTTTTPGIRTTTTTTTTTTTPLPLPVVIGSRLNVCPSGFKAGPGSIGFCEDINECDRDPGLCQQVCYNLWGSYGCGCQSGYRLNADNRSCSDVDECTEYKAHKLCIGICDNTPGSYKCKCPDGYKLGADGRSCQDIDECEIGQVCRGPTETCLNTRGSFHCNKINCPSGYYRDPERKNRCMRTSKYCRMDDVACFRSPSHFSYNYITFVSMLPIPQSGQLELFTMRGTNLPGSAIQFSMALTEVRAPPDVTRATESCFALRRPSQYQAVLVMTRSIMGPQEIQLDLSMEIYHESTLIGIVVAKLFIFVSEYEF